MEMTGESKATSQYFSVYCNPVFENTTSAGKDLMLVMVFSVK